MLYYIIITITIIIIITIIILYIYWVGDPMLKSGNSNIDLIYI